MKVKQVNFWAFIIMAAITVLMVAFSIYATVSSDASVLSGPVTYVIFGIYFLVQVVCICLYKPGASVYKIGFYFTHVGILVLLIGVLLFIMFGKSVYSSVPVNADGQYYAAIKGEEETIDLGFGIKIDTLTVEQYEDGSDKYYGSDVTLYDYSDNTRNYYEAATATLAVNSPVRRNGWKLYFMSYSDGKYSDDDTYLLPYDYQPDENGELAPAPREAVQEFTANGGGEAALRLLADSKYSGAEMTYMIYDRSSSTYTAAGTSASALEQLEGMVTVRVYKGTSSDNAYYVYAAPDSVLVLFKNDPGEFFVIGGMALTVIGIIMMCLIRKRTKLSELPPDEKKDGKEGGESK